MFPCVSLLNRNKKCNLVPGSVSIIPADLTGEELITAQADREFSSDTGWWAKADSAISGGVATVNSVNGYIRKASLLSYGAGYIVGMDILGYTSGSIGVSTEVTTFVARYPNANGVFVVGPFIHNGVIPGALKLLSTVSGPAFDNVSLKLVEYVVGTKSVYSTAWRQNISGLTISGSIAGFIEIISEPLAPGGKAYRISNTDTSNVTVGIALTKSAAISRTYRCSMYAKRVSGSATPTFGMTGGTKADITSATYVPLLVNSAATATTDNLLITVPASTVIDFYLPVVR